MTRDLSHNPPLRRAFALAQRDANREGRPMAVLNLNPYAGLYVVRYWDDRFAGSREFVAKVEPETPHTAATADWQGFCRHEERGR